MNDWHKLHITDKSGKQFFPCVSSPMSTPSEIKNLKRHLESAKINPDAYKFLDSDTAIIVLDGSQYGQVSEIDADALLAELGL